MASFMYKKFRSLNNELIYEVIDDEKNLGLAR